MEKFLRSLTKYQQQASSLTQALGPLVTAQVQQNITDMSSPANAPLTKTLKGNKGPLKDTGVTRASITYVATPETLIAGTNVKHARLINDGGTVTAKKARMLTIPATRQVKLMTNIKGVRGAIKQLESRGWNVLFRGGAVIGTPPTGAKGIGLKLKPKQKGQKPTYLLYYRKKSIKVPARKFMYLNQQSKDTLKQFALEHLKGSLK